jgi:predicted histone-like DNA-binding protein
MVTLKGIPKRNPQAPAEDPKFYASLVHEERVEIDALATKVSQRCSLRRSDVHGVLVALMDIIPEQLLNGDIVALGELGSFCAAVSSEGVDSVDDLSVTMVRGAKIQYRPTKELKKKLRMLDYTIAS